MNQNETFKLDLERLNWISKVSDEYLLSLDINLQHIFTEEFDQTLLHQLTQFKDSRPLRILIKKFTNIDPKDKNGSTPLHISCMIGNKEATKILLQHSANVNAQDNLGDTPLMCLLRRNPLEKDLVKLVIEIGQPNMKIANKCETPKRAIDVARGTFRSRDIQDILPLLEPMN